MIYFDPLTLNIMTNEYSVKSGHQINKIDWNTQLLYQPSPEIVICSPYLFFSKILLSMTIESTFCSTIICKKWTVECGRGPWVAIIFPPSIQLALM